MATARKDAEAPQDKKPQTDDPLELAGQAQETAETAIGITEIQGNDIKTLKKEQQALAVLLNTVKQNLEKAGTPAAVLARLEKLESDTRGVRYDWGPQIEALNGHLSALQVTAANHATSLTELLDKTGTEPGGQFEDLVRDLDEVKGGLATAADALEAIGKAAASRDDFTAFGQVVEDRLAGMRSELDSIGDEFPHLRQQLSTNLKELAERLAALESGTQSPKTRQLYVPGVLAKMQAVMDEVTVIAKTREAKPESGSRGPRYNFRGIEDAMNAVGAAMRKVGLLLRPEVISWEHIQNPITTQQSGQNGTYERTLIWTSSYLTMRYVFVDPQDGSEFAIEMVGEGKDSSDKAASKAASMSCKYGLFQALMVPFEGMEESDGQNPQEEWTSRQRANWGPEGSPGQQVNRGTMSPAQAVNEYTHNSPNNPAADGRPEPAEPPEQLAANAALFIRKAQAEATAAGALAKLKQAAARIAELKIGDQVIEGVRLSALLNTALQNTMAAIEGRAVGNAQGMSRAEQQAGRGTRAAASEPDDDPAPGSREEYEQALQVMASPSAPDQVLDAAARIVARWEDAQKRAEVDNDPGREAAIQDYYNSLGDGPVDMTGRDGQW